MAAEPENFKVNVSHTKQNALIGWEVCEIFHKQILTGIAQAPGLHKGLVSSMGWSNSKRRVKILYPPLRAR